MGEEGTVQRAAGVQHSGVGVMGIVGDLGAVLSQLPHHLLAALCDLHHAVLYAGVGLPHRCHLESCVFAVWKGRGAGGGGGVLRSMFCCSCRK